jgi:peroxiredoxin
MRYPLLFTLLIISLTNLAAQDSLRLTIKLDGFKDKDELSVYLIDGQYSLPTDQSELTIYRKLDSPTRLSIYYKSRYKAYWLDNSDVEIFVPKSNFKNGVIFSGTAPQRLWDSLLTASQADKADKAKIIETNLENEVVKNFLALKSYTLLPEDEERLLAQTSDSIQKFAKYNSFSVDVDRGTRLKEGDRMMDFTASTIDKKITDTEDLRGKYILLDFAGTGCGWCWLAYPQMAESLVEYNNLQVLTFNEDYNFKGWQNIADKRNIKLPWPVLWEAENKREILKNYGINVLPTYLLISPEGIILERWQGGKDEKIERMLEKHGVE